uniref:Uncharacterized protein n=1 Tax=Lepeophtheirus salmonis TaxID=72036 RepID=A0A0K2T1D4_LEPSM
MEEEVPNTIKIKRNLEIIRKASKKFKEESFCIFLVLYNLS